MKFFSMLLCFFAFQNLHALSEPNLPVPNQYLIYFENGTTPTEVENIANTWCSTVLVNLEPGTNVALFEFNCSYPYTNPYDPQDIITSLIEVVGNIKKQEPKGDGGSLNYYLGGSNTGINISSCYDENLLVDQTSDNSIVRVAVFDTGTNWELANINGFDFGTPHEMFGDVSDKNGHGTHVSSIVNKTYLNSNGENSPNYVAYVFGNPLDANGQGTLADMVFSMERAIQAGANVINCSFSYVTDKLIFGLPGLGGPGTNGHHIGEEDILYQLMKSANPTTTLFVVSAGNNNGFNLDGPSELNVYPAAFPLENMITVASHGCVESLSEFSNLGSQSVDIAAPGENIVSIDHEMEDVSYSGTSQAAAYVSGAASILGTYLPLFDAAEVKCAIMSKAAYRPSFNGLTVSEGILDIGSAVDYLVEGGCDTGGGMLGQKRIAKDIGNAEISIVPTLVTNGIDINFELSEEGPVTITFYSTKGEVLSSSSFSGTKGSNEIYVNLEHFQANQFFVVKIDANEFSKSTKIFKVE